MFDFATFVFIVVIFVSLCHVYISKRHLLLLFESIHLTISETRGKCIDYNLPVGVHRVNTMTSY